MDVKVISTTAAPAAIGPYSQGILTGNMAFLSGQLGIDPSTGKLAEGGVKAQAEQSLKNIKALLDSIEATPANIVKTTIYLVDMADFASVNEIYAKFFDGTYPARSCVAVHQLPMNGQVEIEVTATC
ncbi:RidA family protein [uncultured Mailhella sp.]|uniref:RidA family protein n=1 Tax=uncultured Mailhella sp. TaxID=1981031 RepID=UPI0025F6DA3C|nr:RidA family protein [uncultured Mailhella sp.]